MSRSEIDDKVALAEMAKLIERGASARQAAAIVAKNMGAPQATERLRRKEQEARMGRGHCPRFRFTRKEWESIERAAGLGEPTAWLRKVILAAAAKTRPAQ